MLSRLQQNVLLSSIPPQLLVTRRLSRSHLPFVFREDIKEAAADWGLECLRYEIKDINVPAGIKAAMELQVGASTALTALQHQGSAAWGLHAWGCWSGMWCRDVSACIQLPAHGYAGAVHVRAMSVWLRLFGYSVHWGTGACTCWQHEAVQRRRHRLRKQCLTSGLQVHASSCLLNEAISPWQPGPHRQRRALCFVSWHMAQADMVSADLNGPVGLHARAATTSCSSTVAPCHRAMTRAALQCCTCLAASSAPILKRPGCRAEGRGGAAQKGTGAGVRGRQAGPHKPGRG